MDCRLARIAAARRGPTPGTFSRRPSYVQLLVNSLGQPVTEPRNGRQQLDRVGTAAQPLELDPLTGSHDFLQGGSDSSPNAR
jgi:hypothetical protein